MECASSRQRRRLATAGRPATEIAGYLGHGSADVTLGIYAHWFPKDRTGAMESHASRVLGLLSAAGSRNGPDEDAGGQRDVASPQLRW